MGVNRISTVRASRRHVQDPWCRGHEFGLQTLVPIGDWILYDEADTFVAISLESFEELR